MRVLSEESTGLTTTTAHTGTTRYLSHELVSTDAYPTSASDVYAVACLGLEFIFLKSPYANQTKPGLIYNSILQGILPATHLSCSSIPGESIVDLWARLVPFWDTDPQNRPQVIQLLQFIGEFEDSLLEALDDLVVIPKLVT